MRKLMSLRKDGAPRPGRPFPQLGVLAAAIASYGLLRDEPVVATTVAVFLAMVGLVGAVVYRRRKMSG